MIVINARLLSMRKVLVGCALLLSVMPGAGQVPGRQVVDEMIHAIDHTLTLQGRIKRTERVKGVMEPGELRFKLMVRPYKLYVYNLLPDEGAELLYVPGWNDSKVLVHPNKFPWINLSFGPHSLELTKSGHHPLTCIGFAYTGGIIRHLMALYGDRFDEMVQYQGRENWYGKSMHVIKITCKDYHFDNYTVKAGEDVFDIDEKLKVPAYKIVELNGMKNFLDVKPGQVIRVPNVYAREMVIMVDPDSHLPIVQLIFDDKGLFEKYEYSELKVNVRFSTLDFLAENEAYGF